MMTPPGTPLASLDLLRQITDRHVIGQLLAVPSADAGGDRGPYRNLQTDHL